MAIIISGLGLLGLAAYTAEKKKKEISIRKILGASVPGIVSMISKDFLKLSLIATIIGCVIAYFLMEKFLSSYKYSTDFKLGNICNHCAANHNDYYGNHHHSGNESIAIQSGRRTAKRVENIE